MSDGSDFRTCWCPSAFNLHLFMGLGCLAWLNWVVAKAETNAEDDEGYKMAGAAAHNDLTILDYLNEDCWGSILNYLSIRDIAKTERVSRQWQQMVLGYLSSTRINVETSDCSACYFYADDCHICHRHRRTIIFRYYQSPLLKIWLNKVVPIVVALECNSEDIWSIIRDNCPNLKEVKFTFPFQLREYKPEEHFKFLQKLVIAKIPSVSDDFISQFISSKVLEELTIHECDSVSGQCLSNLKSVELKTLSIKAGKMWDIRHVISAGDYFNELTKFEISISTNAKIHDIQFLVAKMTKLEELDVDIGGQGSREFFGTVCRLSSLKHLGVNMPATVADLESVARCCQELRSLELGTACTVTGAGLAAIFRYAGTRLTALGLLKVGVLDDDDLLFCVRSCPNLRSLAMGAKKGSYLTEKGILMATLARRELGLQQKLLFTGCIWYEPYEEYDEPEREIITEEL